jgi:hypothetical protein
VADEPKVVQLKLVDKEPLEVTPDKVREILIRAKQILAEHKIVALAIVAIDDDHDPYIISRAEPHARTSLVGGLDYLKFLLNQEQVDDMQDSPPPKGPSNDEPKSG